MLECCCCLIVSLTDFAALIKEKIPSVSFVNGFRNGLSEKLSSSAFPQNFPVSSSLLSSSFDSQLESIFLLNLFGLYSLMTSDLNFN